MAKNEIVKDSGSTQEFSTGAHRDCSVGKGRCDLLVLDYAGLFMMDDPVLANVSIFMEERDPKYLLDALQCSLNTVPVFRYNEILAEMEEQGVEMRVYEDEKEKSRACMAHVLLETSKMFELGALKYGGVFWSQRNTPEKETNLRSNERCLTVKSIRVVKFHLLDECRHPNP